jgi:AAA15 family ATPase/GTPase
MIEELVLENFRGFRKLDLQDLKPVNLIVGHNNTGKTSLLEGILLSCQPTQGNNLPGMFRATHGPDELRYFPWLIRDGAQNDTATLKKCADGVVKDKLIITKSRRHSIDEHDLPLVTLGPLTLSYGPKRKDLICRVVSIQNHNSQSLVSLIGKAYRKRDGEENFQNFFKIIDSRIKRVRLVPGEDQESIQVVVDIGLSEMLPLAQVGEGVYHLATILGNLIGEKTDVLLIDEIENGLHHSVHRQIWAGLAKVAKELNVQIFATTHSGECLQAAHWAFLERKPYDFRVIQLFRSEGAVQGRVLDQEHIEAAIEADIELR